MAGPLRSGARRQDGAEASPWRILAGVASQTAVLVAVLFYFGWATAGATFGYFGVDLSLLQFSTSDYLLRGLYSAYQPLLIIGIAALAALCLHQAAVARARASTPGGLPSWSLYVPVAALGIGVSALGVGIVSLAIAPLSRALDFGVPAALAGGAVAVAYADYAWPLFRPATHADYDDRARRARSFLLITLATLAVFWWLAGFAVDVGKARARSLAKSLPSKTEVALYSTRRLAIPTYPGGASEEALGTDPALSFRYRYTNLRLLIHAGGRLFLLPANWRRGAPIFEIRDSDAIRADFTTGP